jgi:hypothetical protein
MASDGLGSDMTGRDALGGSADFLDLKFDRLDLQAAHVRGRIATPLSCPYRSEDFLFQNGSTALSADGPTYRRPDPQTLAKRGMPWALGDGGRNCTLLPITRRKIRWCGPRWRRARPAHSVLPPSSGRQAVGGQRELR